MEEGDDEPVRQIISGAESLDALITEYMDRERNNEIVAEFYPFLENSRQDEEGELEQERLGENQEDEDTEEEVPAAPAYYSWAEGPSEATKIRLATQFVIDGMATFDLNIYQ
jgi:hypothetical protein